MPDDCVICETVLDPGAAHCGRCGFPPGLADLALAHLGEEVDVEFARDAAAPPRAPEAAPPSPETEANAGFAGALGATLEIIRELSGDPADVIGELRQAALLEAEGRTSEALSVLRGAQQTASSRVGALFELRLKELEDRQQLLVSQGLAPEFVQDSLRLRAEFAEAPIEIVAEHLAEAERTLATVENDWQELRTMLRQVDQMRLAARKLGHTFPPIEEELGRVRAVLAQPAITHRELAGAIAGMHRVLRTFHEDLTPNLREELDRHATYLSQLSPVHAPSKKARQMHAEANRHLQNGRLAEASLRLFELREALLEAEREAAPTTEAESPEGAPPGRAPAGERKLSDLLVQARELAARIRDLPPESPIAHRAAAQIRRATELLRDQKLDEAGASLAELMRSLDRPAPGGGG